MVQYLLACGWIGGVERERVGGGRGGRVSGEGQLAGEREAAEEQISYVYVETNE